MIGRPKFDEKDGTFAFRYSVTHDDRFVYSTTQDMAGEIVSQALDTHDALVRKALIEMGWTPPAAK